jgi:hypothetical protein
MVAAILIFLLVSVHLSSSKSFFPLYFKILAELPSKQIDGTKLYRNIGFGIDRAALLFFGSLLLLYLFKKNRLSRTVFSTLVIALVMADLWLSTMPLIKTHHFPTSPDIDSIKGQLNQTPVQGRIVTIGRSFDPNDGLRYRFPSILGYDPLILGRYVVYIQDSQDLPQDLKIVSFNSAKHPDAKLLRMLNVRQVVLGQEVPLRQCKFPHRKVGNSTIINIDDAFFAYATIVNKAIIKKEDEILDFMEEKSFDPRHTVVLESAYTHRDTNNPRNADFEASCSVLQYDSEYIRISASATQPGYLVLSEVFYPGWEALVDGKKVPVLRGNYLFRVVPMDRGDHEVVLRFVSWPFRIGAIISLLTLACSLFFILWKRNKDSPIGT